MSDVLSSVERVLEATTDLRKLRNRLAKLNAERAAIEEQIQRRLAEISGTVTPAAPPPPSQPSHVPVTPSERILDVMNREPNVIFTAMDFAERWNATSETTINAYRATLWRLNAKGKIQKVSFGRYKANSA